MENERGSVIIWLLIAMILFAALSFVMMRGSRSSSAIIGTEEANTYAKQIIAQSEEVKQAIKRLGFRGCKDTDISYEHDGIYVNPTSPPGNRCHIFHPSGGGLTYRKGPAKAYTASGDANIHLRGDVQVVGSGTAEADLMIRTPHLTREVCLAINDLLGVNNPSGEPPADINTGGGGEFVGVYGTTQADGIGDDAGSGLSGKGMFCRNNGGMYQYVHVMIAR